MSPRVRNSGFTMIELLIAIGLFAIMSGVIYGSLRLAGRTTDAGEAKAQAASGMRLASDYLRTQLAAQHPQRMRKIVEFPLLFGGDRSELRFAAPLPARVGVGGMWYFRLVLAPSGKGEGKLLVLERMVPELDALQMPSFGDVERSVLAEDIKSLEFQYYGRDRNASPDTAPTWRNTWENAQTLPLLIEVNVAPRTGPAWPPIVVAPRVGPEAGCRAWDNIRGQCAGV